MGQQTQQSQSRQRTQSNPLATAARWLHDPQSALEALREQLGGKAYNVITPNRVVPVGQVDSNLARQSLIAARRTGQHPQVVSKSAEVFWGGAPVQLPQFPAAEAGSGGASGRTDPMAIYSLPISFRAVTATSAPVSVQAVVMVLTGLHYQESTRRFTASIAVGLRDTDRPANRSSLGSSLKLVIGAPGADEVTPKEVEIRKLGDPQMVEISAVAPASPFIVAAKTLLDAGDQIEIPVEATPVIVRAARAEIDCCGLNATTLLIEVPGPQVPGSHSISLSTDLGEIDPKVVQLDAQGRARAELRSVGQGIANITARGAPFGDGKTTVRFRYPLGFALATLAGGLAGWLVKKKARDLSPRSCAVSIGSATILGIAYAIGIRWMPWTPGAAAGEALSFFVAAMGAYTGLKVLTQHAAEEEDGEAGAEPEKTAPGGGAEAELSLVPAGEEKRHRRTKPRSMPPDPAAVLGAKLADGLAALAERVAVAAERAASRVRNAPSGRSAPRR
jgi:hypothetical protein